MARLTQETAIARHIGGYFQTHLAGRYRPEPRLEFFDHNGDSAIGVTSWNNKFVMNWQNWKTFAQALLDASQNDVGVGPHEPNTKIAAEVVRYRSIALGDSLQKRIRPLVAEASAFLERADRRSPRIERYLKPDLDLVTRKVRSDIVNVSVPGLVNHRIEHLTVQRAIVCAGHAYHSRVAYQPATDRRRDKRPLR
jgi:hypothetical protein